MAELTARQAAAMPDVVARVARHDVEVPGDIHRWDRVEWQDETRPGRGHAINALHFYDSSYFVQLLMDVYGSPSISVCSFEPIHNDGDDDCDCGPCEDDRDAEDRVDDWPAGVGTMHDPTDDHDDRGARGMTERSQ